MTRAELKKQIGAYRPSLLRPSMMPTASERKLARLEENVWLRYEREKLDIYRNKTLTDEQRSESWRKASDRRWAGSEKLRSLRRLCERIRERRMLKVIGASRRRSS